MLPLRFQFITGCLVRIWCRFDSPDSDRTVTGSLVAQGLLANAKGFLVLFCGTLNPLVQGSNPCGPTKKSTA